MSSYISDSLVSAVREGKSESVKEIINSFEGSNRLPPLDIYILLLEANENNHVEIAKFLLSNITEFGNTDTSDKPLALTEGQDFQKDGNSSLFSTLLVLAAMNCENMEVVNMVVNKNPSISETVLFVAIQNDRMDIVTLLLDRGFNINVSGTGGITPLQFAVQINKILIHDSLSNRGVDVMIASNSSGATPLVNEFSNGFLSVVKKLVCKTPCVTGKIGERYYIDYKRFSDNIPLHVAIGKGHAKMVKLLLSRGGNIHLLNKDGETAFQLALNKRHNFPKEKQRAIILAYIVMSHLDVNNNNNRSSVLDVVEASKKEYIDVLSDFTCRRTYITRTIFEVMYHNRASDCERLMSLVLHAAVEKGHSRIVTDLFACGIDVKVLYNRLSMEGFTLLHSAANSKQFAMVELLLKYGADINASDMFKKTPIYYAIENGDFKMAAHLLASGAGIKNRPYLLNTAVRKASKDIIHILLQHNGSDVNAKDECGSTALHFTGLQKQQKMGVNDKMSIDYDHDTKDCINIKADIAEFLISRGAEINACNERGQTPLHAAAKRGYAEVVEVLLKHNADVTAVDNDGATPLHFAAWHTSGAIATMLIRKKADVNARRKDGSSVLRDAVARCNQRVIKLLLRHGADINATCKCGNVLLECHTLNRHRRVRRIGSERWLEISDVLKEHIVKMRAANLYVSAKNVAALREVSGELRFFDKECKKEIEQMKIEKIGGKISFYDIATGNPHQVAVHARFTCVAETLATGDYTMRFPIYFDWVEENFKRGQEREVLILSSVDALYSMLGFGIPDILTVDIFGFLSNDDLKNLTAAGDYVDRNSDIGIQDVDRHASHCSVSYSGRRNPQSRRRFNKRSGTMAAIGIVRQTQCPGCVVPEPNLQAILTRRGGSRVTGRPSPASRLFGNCPSCSNLDLCPLKPM